MLLDFRRGAMTPKKQRILARRGFKMTVVSMKAALDAEEMPFSSASRQQNMNFDLKSDLDAEETAVLLAIHTKTEQITIKMANVVPACWSLNVADMRQVTSLFIHPQLLFLHASTKKVNKFGNDIRVYTKRTHFGCDFLGMIQMFTLSQMMFGDHCVPNHELHTCVSQRLVRDAHKYRITYAS